MMASYGGSNEEMAAVRPPAAKKQRGWSFSRRLRSVSDVHDELLSPHQKEVLKQLLTAGDSKVNSALDAYSEGDTSQLHALAKSGYINSSRLPPEDFGAGLASNLTSTLQVSKKDRRNTSFGSMGEYLVPLPHTETAAEVPPPVRTEEPVQPMDSVLAQSLLSTWPQLKKQALGLDKLPKQDEVAAALQRLQQNQHNTAPSAAHSPPDADDAHASAKKTTSTRKNTLTQKRPRGASNVLSVQALGFGSFDVPHADASTLSHDVGGSHIPTSVQGSFDFGRAPAGSIDMSGMGLSARHGSISLPALPGANIHFGAYDPGATQAPSLGFGTPHLHAQAADTSGLFMGGLSALGPTFPSHATTTLPVRQRLLSDLDVSANAHAHMQVGSPDNAFGTGVPYAQRHRGSSVGFGALSALDTVFAATNPDRSMTAPDAEPGMGFPSDTMGYSSSRREDTRTSMHERAPAAGRASSRLKQRASMKKEELYDDGDEGGLPRSSLELGLSSSTAMLDIWDDGDGTAGGAATSSGWDNSGHGGAVAASDSEAEAPYHEEDEHRTRGGGALGKKRAAALRQMAVTRVITQTKARTPRQMAAASAAMHTRAINFSTKRFTMADDDGVAATPDPLLPNVTVKNIGGVEVPIVQRLPGHIGAYSVEERQKRLERFMEKRAARIWHKNIKYEVRKNFADSRLRVKGRFVPKDHEQLLREFMMMI